MKRCLRYFIALWVVVIFSLNSTTAFAKHHKHAVAPTDAAPAASAAPADNDVEIISPDSAQGLQSAQNVTVSKSQLISLDYTDAQLVDVLKAISYACNINIVISRELNGTVSAKLKDFNLNDALNVILGIHGYGFMLKGGIYYVMAKADLDQVTETLPLSFVTLKEAETLLNGTKVKFNGTIQENEDDNALVVTATPADMAMIKSYLRGIDVPPIEVMIDAELVNISKNDSKNIGTTINVSYNPANGMGLNILSGDGASASSSSGSSSNSTTNNTTTNTTSTTTSTTGLPNAVQGTGSGTDSGIFGMSGSWKNFSPSVAINALVSENKARVIASPSIATLNGHEASILIGDHYPYVSSSTSTSQAGATGVTQQTQTQYIDIGTKLKVTPMVSPDGWITLQVEPEVSSLNGIVNGNPDISTTSASTEVRVRDNQTIVIGGLDSRNISSSHNGTPGLMSIPFFGWLFKHNTSSTMDGTLTVLITPHIVPMSPVMPSNTAVVSLNPSMANGEDSNLIRGLLDEAEALEQDKSKDSVKNLYISEEQIKIYRKILQQFPQSGKTDFCLYKIALLYGKDFGNCAAAKEALTEMEDFSSQSPFIKVTELFVNACTDVGEGDKQ